jgi:hypothetical protein
MVKVTGRGEHSSLLLYYNNGTVCFKNVINVERQHLLLLTDICALYHKHFTIVNDYSSIINKFGASFADAARVIIYNRHMFIVQATVIKALIDIQRFYF